MKLYFNIYNKINNPGYLRCCYFYYDYDYQLIEL